MAIEPPSQARELLAKLASAVRSYEGPTARSHPRGLWILGSTRRVGSSERETATIRLAAALTVQGRIARDERVAGEGLTRVLNAQARALRELRLMRHRTPLRV
jgi:hypothetical protein